VPAKAPENAGLALARFVLFFAPMFSTGSSWPRGSWRPNAPNGSMNPSTADHAPGTRPQSSESGAHAHGPVRPIEPHWETVIDRATD